MNKIAFRNIFLIWLAWVLIVIGMQAWVTARFQPQWPDRAQEWTEESTVPSKYQKGQIYLLDPFMNDQVAWDSEYYLATAVEGYDSPHVHHLTQRGSLIPANEPTDVGKSYSESYAFFPLYSWMIWLFAWPLKIFGLDQIATATLAGVVVSALGTLGAMLALYDLTKDSLGEDGAMRAIFYLLIFPTGFFLVQIYTEGLFVGLAFGCLAMTRRGKWIPAALLGAAATLTRAVGIALIIPMAITWIRTGEWMDLDLEWRQIFLEGIPWRKVGAASLALAPLITFLLWKFSYLGVAFSYIESNFFGRGTLNFGYAFYSWSEVFKNMFAGNPAATAYWLTELIGLVIGIVTCFACIKYYPEIAWFSIAVLVISWGSGPAQGIVRYVLSAPAVFIMLARWGKNPVFDRAWTIFSLMLMSLLAALFAFNYWVA